MCNSKLAGARNNSRLSDDLLPWLCLDFRVYTSAHGIKGCEEAVRDEQGAAPATLLGGVGSGIVLPAAEPETAQATALQHVGAADPLPKRSTTSSRSSSW